MEAGILFLNVPLKQPPSRCPLPSFPRFSRASSNLQRGYKGPKPRRQLLADWVSSNDDFVRTLPIYVGGVSLLAFSAIGHFQALLLLLMPASNSQSRADLLTLGLAVTNILTGLVWLSIRPKSISVVNPQGLECQRIYTNLPDVVVSEIMWSLVIVYDSRCVLQVGFAAASSSSEGEAVVVDASKLMQGSLYQGVLKSGSCKQCTMFFELLCMYPEFNKLPAQDLSLKRKNLYLPVTSESYLANLSLYPGKSDLPFLPSNAQAVILQPLGDKGAAIIGGNTIRGFTTSDQAWISLIGEKLDATLTKHVNNLPLAMHDRS